MSSSRERMQYGKMLRRHIEGYAESVLWYYRLVALIQHRLIAILHHLISRNPGKQRQLVDADGSAHGWHDRHKAFRQKAAQLYKTEHPDPPVQMPCESLGKQLVQMTQSESSTERRTCCRSNRKPMRCECKTNAVLMQSCSKTNSGPHFIRT